MTGKEKRLILDLVKGSLTIDEFLRIYPVNIKERPNHVTEILNSILLKKASGDIEFALLLGFRFGFPNNCVEILCNLLIEEWHQKHEDIARILQEKKDPKSIESLYGCTQKRYSYLEYNDSSALAIKCVWALGKIGTDEAVEKLKMIVNSDNREDVRKTAEKQINSLKSQ